MEDAWHVDTFSRWTSRVAPRSLLRSWFTVSHSAAHSSAAQRPADRTRPIASSRVQMSPHAPGRYCCSARAQWEMRRGEAVLCWHSVYRCASWIQRTHFNLPDRKMKSRGCLCNLILSSLKTAIHHLTCFTSSSAGIQPGDKHTHTITPGVILVSNQL